MKVREIMTDGVEKINARSNVKEAIDRMMELHITSLIVDKRDDDDAYGIITRKDIINKVIAERIDPKEVRVSKIMSKPLLTVHPDDDIRSVAKLMAKTNIRRFPVHNGHDLVGLISNSDIFRAHAVD